MKDTLTLWVAYLSRRTKCQLTPNWARYSYLNISGLGYMKMKQEPKEEQINNRH